MKNSTLRRITFIVLATLVFGIAGCFAGQLVLGGIESGKLAWWHSLGKPPEGAIRFLKLEPNFSNRTAAIYVETSSGKTYRCCAQAEGNWEEASFLQDRLIAKCEDYYAPSKHPAFSVWSNKLRDCTSLIWAWEMTADKDYFVILTDGSVWKWRYYTGLVQVLGLLGGLPVLAIAIGWGLIGLIRKGQASRA